MGNNWGFKCRKFDLQNELQALAQVADKKNKDEIYSCVHLSSTDQGLIMAAAARELMLMTSIKIDKGGSLVQTEIAPIGTLATDVDKFLALCKKLPDKIIEISYDDNLKRATVRCDSSRFQLACQEPMLFPSVKHLATAQFTYTLPLRFIRDALSRSLGIVELKEGSNPHESGILFSLQDGLFEVVATDGKRMAVSFVSLETDKKFRAIIPKKTLAEMLAVIEGTQQTALQLEVTDNAAFFKFGKYVYRSAIMTGNFPNYNALVDAIRSKNDLQFKIKRNTLRQSLDRVLLFSGKNQGHGVNFEFGDKEVAVMSANEKGETAYEVVESEGKKGFSLRLNGQYLIEYLDSIQSDESFELWASGASHLDPVILRSQSDRNYYHIIVPMERL